MGIKSLSKILKKYSPEVYREKSLQEYAGKKIGVDISLYMYKYKCIFGEAWLNAFVNLICCLRKHNIHLLFIFDSKAPIEKREEQEERRRNRQKLVEKLQNIEKDYDIYKETGEISQLLNDLCINKDLPQRLLTKDIRVFREDTVISKINTLRTQTISIDKEDFKLARKLFRRMKVPYVDARSEAEATGAYLTKIGKLYGIMTADTDVLAYGATKFINSVNTNNNTCIEIDMQELLGRLEMTQYQFRDMCIMCGTDYNKNIPKIGPMKSYDLIKEYNNIDEIGNNTKLDISILKHERSRELFSFCENYFEKKVTFCGIPNINKLVEFLVINNCKVNREYLVECLENNNFMKFEES